MALFGKGRHSGMPVFDIGEDEPVVRCSICTGEQVLCARDKEHKLKELMLIRNTIHRINKML